jgi:hypothetical protein
MSQSGLIESGRIEKIVLAAGLLLLLVPGTILFSNVQIANRFFSSKDILTLSPIGEVVNPSRIVRRRGEDDPAFLTIKSGDPVFVGDTIITGKQSSTRINLSDGSVIEVGPESMLKIAPVRTFSFKGIQKKINVTVQAGAIKARVDDEASPIVFQSLKGEVLKEIKPAPTPASAPQAPVTEPLAKTDPLLPAQTQAPETAATPAPEEFVTITAAPPAEFPVAPPSPTASMAPIAQAPVPAPEAPPAPAAQAQALPPEALTRPEAPRLITDFLSNLKPEPAETPIQQETKQAPQAESPLLSKYVAPLNPVPDLEVTPLPATPLISDEADLKEQRFVFKWKDGGFQVKLPYILKIEHEGQTLKFETDQTEYSWSLPLAAEGKIRWWVEAMLRNGNTVQSKKQDSSWKLPVPVLASPGNGLDLPEFYLKGESHEVLLTWKQMQICSSFELNVSKTADFKEVLFKAVTKRNFHTFPVQKPGRYFWRVGCNYTTEFKAFSGPFSFKLSRLN